MCTFFPSPRLSFVPRPRRLASGSWAVDGDAALQYTRIGSVRVRTLLGCVVLYSNCSWRHRHVCSRERERGGGGSGKISWFFFLVRRGRLELEGVVVAPCVWRKCNRYCEFVRRLRRVRLGLWTGGACNSARLQLYSFMFQDFFLFFFFL